MKQRLALINKKNENESLEMISQSKNTLYRHTYLKQPIRATGAGVAICTVVTYAFFGIHHTDKVLFCIELKYIPYPLQLWFSDGLVKL